MRTIQSRAHPYTVEEFLTLDAAIESLGRLDQMHFLVDSVLLDRLGAARRQGLPESRIVSLEASEHAKSYGTLERVFLDLLERNLKRSGTLVVIGGGVLQDAGCFIASVLSRGIRWVLIPTTLLAQADSCIGSKSSINIGSYKNQLGTFYPPHRVLLVPEVLQTLPYDELRSGLGEVIKLQLLSSEAGFEELMGDLVGFEAFAVERREGLTQSCPGHPVRARLRIGLRLRNPSWDCRHLGNAHGDGTIRRVGHGARRPRRTALLTPAAVARAIRREARGCWPRATSAGLGQGQEELRDRPDMHSHPRLWRDGADVAHSRAGRWARLANNSPAHRQRIFRGHNRPRFQRRSWEPIA